MPLIAKLAERLKRHPKRVVFPEGSDPRILQAARKFATRGLGIPILIGERSTIKSNAEKHFKKLINKYSSKDWNIDLENMIKSIDVYSLGMIMPVLFYDKKITEALLLMVLQ